MHCYATAPVPSRLSPQQLYNAPKVTRSYPFLESYATPDGVFYRSSWGTDLVRFDGKALPAPLNSLELWTEVAPLGRAAPADLEGVVIDPYSYPQEVLVRIPGHENIWALPIPVSVSDHPEDPSSGECDARHARRVAVVTDAGSCPAAAIPVAYRLRASASHHSNGVSSIMGSSDPAVNDLNRALRGAQCDVDCRCRISLAPRTEIGPYTIRGGWPRGFKDVKLDDSLGNGGPAVVISLTGKDARGTVSIEKADVTAHLVVRAFADPIEILTMGPEGGEIEGTTTLNGWQATHRWEGGQEGGGQHDQLGRKLVITASYPGGSNGSGGSPHA